MTETRITRLSFDAHDEAVNPPPATTDFEQIVERATSRRGFLGGAVAFGATAFVLGTTALTARPARAASRLGFEAVPANTLDTVTVPKGYRWQLVASWGDPMWSKGQAFDQATRGTGASDTTENGPGGQSRTTRVVEVEKSAH